MGTLFKEVSFAIGMRADDNPDEVATIMTEMGREYGTAIDYTCIRTPDADFTSTHIRNGNIDASRLHPAIADYIREHRLYLGATAQ